MHIWLLLACPLFAFETYDEARMQSQFGAALATVKQILNTTRHPEFAVDVPHTYQDKYLLAEFLTNTAIVAELNALESMGLKGKTVRLQNWVSKGQAASVGFRARQKCEFLRNESQQVGDSQRVTKITQDGKDTTVSQQTFTTVTSYYYASSFSWQFVAYKGTASSSGATNDSLILLDSRNTTIEVKTTSNSPPSGCVTETSQNMDLDLTWLFQNLDASNKPKFIIDRAKKTCHTPRRNAQVDDAFSFFDRVSYWGQRILQRFPGWATARLTTSIFVPVIPLFENTCDANATSDCNRVQLSVGDLNAFLAEQVSSLDASAKEANQTFPPRSNLTAPISEVEAQNTASLRHQQQIVNALETGVNSIEGMLAAQLIAAIGKEVAPTDFGEYVRFNNRRLFKPEYTPQDLSYSVRRPDHYPEGIVEIQQSDASSSLPFSIQAIVRRDRASSPVNSTLSGGTRISLNGDRYLHAAIFYQFSAQDQAQLKLAARARQFSSFVLLVGTMVSANEFRADIGIIIKDKDDLTIPLLLETIPTPKAFRDAIESLSPEQQAFAKAFRSMQLSSTLFAFAIVQVKPQLEKLMKLPNDSLTKEIQLTQDLMRLFLDYQIPSDLLSFQGAADLSADKKIDYVKAQVTQMKSFIDAEKQAQIKEKQQKDAMTQPPSSPPLVFRSQPVPMMAMAGGLADRAFMPSRVSSASFGVPGASRPAEAAPPMSIPRPASPNTPLPVSPNTPRPTTPNTKQTALSNTSDYTAIPAALDARVLELDDDASLRATIIKPGESWFRQSQKGLLGERAGASLYGSDQTTERQKAFDLLEALSKSGILGFDDAEVHVVIGSTQNFDETLMDTVIQDNDNPIDQFERSSLIVATTIFGQPAVNLVAEDQVPRLAAFSPKLFPDATTPSQ